MVDELPSFSLLALWPETKAIPASASPPMRTAAPQETGGPSSDDTDPLLVQSLPLPE